MKWISIRLVYRQILRFLVREELRKITDTDTYTLDDLINYHDFMAIECMDNRRILGVSIQSAIQLDKLKKLQESKKV